MTKLSERLEALAEKATVGAIEAVIDDKDILIGPKGETYYRNAFARFDYDDVDHEAAEADASLYVELVNNLPTIIEALKAKDL